MVVITEEGEKNHKGERRKVQIESKIQNVVVIRGRSSNFQSSLYHRNRRGSRWVRCAAAGVTDLVFGILAFESKKDLVKELNYQVMTWYWKMSHE